MDDTHTDTPQSESYKPEQTLEESAFGSASDLGKGRQIETDSCEDKQEKGMGGGSAAFFGHLFKQISQTLT